MYKSARIYSCPQKCLHQDSLCINPISVNRVIYMYHFHSTLLSWQHVEQFI
jgi:hypothetical protein